MTLAQWMAAAGVFAVGVLASALIGVLVNRLLGRLLPDTERGARQRRSAARGAFAVVLGLAIAAAISVLAPRLFADIPSQVVAFLPNLAVAVLLLGLGAVLSTLVEQLVTAAFNRIGVPNAGAVGRVTYWIIFGLAIILASDQLGIKTAALQRLLLVVLLVAGTATALAVGMGGTRLAGSVIAGRYVEERFAVGDRIEVEQWRGTISNVGLASTALELDDGDSVEVPHSYLLERPVRRLSAPGASAAQR